VEGCKGLAHRETSGSRSSYTLSVKLFPAGQQRTWAVHIACGAKPETLGEPLWTSRAEDFASPVL
jgi:hypothetical protein